ncbi:MAG: ABC transporter ATP-binding protein, partial [Methanobacteriota archaeon]
MARVKLRGLTKAYDGVLAVKGLDLEVKDKEFVVLLGPSGCGKTTTLRCIAGLESATDGEIYIGDQLVNDLDPKDRNIAMVFQ